MGRVRLVWSRLAVWSVLTGLVLVLSVLVAVELARSADIERPAWADKDVWWLSAIFVGTGNVVNLSWQMFEQWRVSRRPGVPAAQRYMALSWLSLFVGLVVWALGLLAVSAWITFMWPERAAVLRWGLLTGPVAITGGVIGVRYFRHLSDLANTRRDHERPE